MAQLRSHGIRAEVDMGTDRMQKKIPHRTEEGSVSYCWPGDDDVAKDAKASRYLAARQNNGVPIGDAVAEIVTAVQERQR